MTIGAIILDVCILVTILGMSISVYNIAYENGLKNAIILFVVGTIILSGIIGFQFYYYNNLESGKRAMKTQQSEFKGGLKREIVVYDVNGKVIERFKGKFDVEYDDDRILFDDEKGNRHVIYYPTGTVIINELKGED